MKKLLLSTLTALMIFSSTSVFGETDNEKSWELGAYKMVPIPSKDYMNFMMLETEVTQKLYKDIMGKNPGSPIGDNLPVNNVTLRDAMEFCNALSKKCSLTPAYTFNKKEIIVDVAADGFRLPTQAEWIHAAGDDKYLYAGSDDIEKVAWYKENCKEEDGNGKIHPVGNKNPNEYGLYDMSGNVWEWCWGNSWGNNIDNPTKGYYEGGSFQSSADYCSISEKHSEIFFDSPKNKKISLGFRIVCTKR